MCLVEVGLKGAFCTRPGSKRPLTMTVTTSKSHVSVNPSHTKKGYFGAGKGRSIMSRKKARRERRRKFYACLLPFCKLSLRSLRRLILFEKNREKKHLGLWYLMFRTADKIFFAPGNGTVFYENKPEF